MHEICKTYFTFKNRIVNGWKIIKNGQNSYNVYTYTTCKKLNNWQIFFENFSYDRLLQYFEKRIDSLEEQQDTHNNTYSRDWVSAENKWNKETLNMFMECVKNI